MLEIGAYEAKNKLSALLDRVEAGEEIIITRRGKVVARMVQPVATFDREAAVAAVKRMLERSKGVTTGGISIKEMINEGRR
ncbi:MAG: type II toxin-antitoxin system Phd/YefM family antitoxin [Rickettsiales bacterium]